MEKSIIVAGFGGQGVMVIGQLLAYTACADEEKYVTFFPSYGAEQRGGTANCYVVISDHEIGAPKKSRCDCLVVLNEPSMERFADALMPGGVLFVNSTLVKKVPERSDIHVVEINAGSMAIDLGNPKVMNLIVVGAVVGYTEILPPESVLEMARKKLGAKRPEMNPLNEKAFRCGFEVGKNARENGK